MRKITEISIWNLFLYISFKSISSLEAPVKTEQYKWTSREGWSPALPTAKNQKVHLLLVFGATAMLKNKNIFPQLKKSFPSAHFFGCSTAGEIIDTHVTENSVVATAVQFERTQIKGISVQLNNAIDSYGAGEHLAKGLPPAMPSLESAGTDPLVHAIVLSDGLCVNGSDLVRGLAQNLPAGVTLTGGLAGDGESFSETLTFLDAEPARDTVALIGLYSTRLKVGYGSLGGWDPFGPERLVTRSKNNVLYELDGHSALELYKKYLGDHAKGLPATGLLFPLSLRTKSGETAVVRTILSVNEEEQSMTFAGDMPEGSYTRLMKANFDRLIDGAVGAARTSLQAIGSAPPNLAILISCVGRKLVLKQRVEEEVEDVHEILGRQATIAGFYSYGEISPFIPGAKCDLHNQTMTITTLLEA